MAQSPEQQKKTLETEAKNLGFVLFGCSKPGLPLAEAAYQRWLAEGRQADMHYLAREDAVAARLDPSLLLRGVKTVISLAVPYSLVHEPITSCPEPCGQIAAYACYEDYHLLMQRMGNALIEKAKALIPEAQFRLCVDAEPVLEKAYAQKAGLGWIGQNSLLFNPQYGSALLLAELLTDADLPPDLPLEGDPCQTCGLCLSACPTQALDGARGLDARRCFSYLSIENRGPIPQEFQQAMGSRIFGCDTCQLVCPYNQIPHPFNAASPLKRLHQPWQPIEAELALSPEAFKAKYQYSPILRAQFEGYQRNLRIAAGNAADQA